jgi:hypothetical protein
MRRLTWPTSSQSYARIKSEIAGGHRQARRRRQTLMRRATTGRAATATRPEGRLLCTILASAGSMRALGLPLFPGLCMT